MTQTTTVDAYGVLTQPDTLRIQRLLPGPVDRVWNYLTQSDLRRKWLAAGDMDMTTGSGFELVWRNSELSDPPGQRPPGFSEEHRMESRITELEPLRRLAFTWGSTGGVTFELEPQGSDVLLTVTHRRLADRDLLLKVSAGWHSHLDVLAARINGQSPEPFWEKWLRLRDAYEARLPQ